MAQANSNDLVQLLRTLLGVTKVVVLKEARTKLGATEAYPIVSELTLQDGRKRVRDTFPTFNDGYVYFPCLGCPAGA